jgi:hypothetical protein
MNRGRETQEKEGPYRTQVPRYLREGGNARDPTSRLNDLI